MGYQSVLVDALWDKQIGRDKIEELVKYGKDKGVALYLWYNSNGYWNDAPQTPRGIMAVSYTHLNDCNERTVMPLWNFVYFYR